MANGAGFFDTGANCPDLVIENGQIKFENGLETAVMISLFSDRYVSPENLPSGINESRGWWADDVISDDGDLIGSELWIYERGKITPQTANQMRDAAKASLDWMLESGLAKSVNVTSSVVTGERIDLFIEIARPEGDNIPFKFVWDGQALKRA